jgi:hypothetical protein
VPPGFFCGFCLGGRVWVCCAWLVSLGLLGSNCLQFGLLNSESRARCSGTSGSGQGFRLTLVWMGPGGRAPVPVVQKNEKKDKRLRADRSRQKHLNRWQEDQIPPASRSFCCVQPHQVWKEGSLHPHVPCFLPGLDTRACRVPAASRPSRVCHQWPGSPPNPPLLRLEGSRSMSPTGWVWTAAFLHLLYQLAREPRAVTLKS